LVKEADQLAPFCAVSTMVSEGKAELDEEATAVELEANLV